MYEIYYRPVELPNTRVRGAVIEDADGNYNVYVNSRLGFLQRCEAARHELNHITKGHLSEDISLEEAEHERDEREAARERRFELERFMPVIKLIQAYEYGFSGPLDLAEYLNLSIESLQYVLEYYYSIYGPRSTHGEYIITWNPFKIKKKRCRKAK